MSAPSARLGPLERILDSKLIAALASPRHVDSYLELVDPTWSLRECRARVVDVRREAGGMVTLELEPNRRFAGHRAGEWLTLTATIDGVRHARCFSIASAPGRATIELTIRPRPDGVVSRWAAESARPGDVVLLGAPQGDFVLPTPAPEHVLLVSGGSGVTPCMSILREVIDRSPSCSVTFLHFARTYADVPFHDELRAIAARAPQVRLAIALTREAPREGDLAGHLSDAMLASLAPDAAKGHVYVCGPASLVDAVSARYAPLALDGRLHVERFVAPRRVLELELDVAADAPRRLLFRKSGTIAPGTPARSLLEQAEAAGLSPAHGCRMGICQTCRCGKSAGVVRDLVSGELLDETVTEIRLCITAPVTDVTLDL